MREVVLGELLFRALLSNFEGFQIEFVKEQQVEAVEAVASLSDFRFHLLVVKKHFGQLVVV